VSPSVSKMDNSFRITYKNEPLPNNLNYRTLYTWPRVNHDSPTDLPKVLDLNEYLNILYNTKLKGIVIPILTLNEGPSNYYPDCSCSQP
jgi:hypothetical protein